MVILSNQSQALHFPFNQVMGKDADGNVVAITAPLHNSARFGNQWLWACGIARLASTHLRPVFTDFFIVGYLTYSDRPADLQSDVEKEITGVFSHPITVNYLMNWFKRANNE